jgi:co-chaperonin GroES (HSP10)
MPYPKPVFNHLLVRVKSEKANRVKLGALELEIAGIDYNTDASAYAQTMGEVLSVPRAMSKGIPYEYIEPEVQIGDEVVLHYNAITEDAEVEYNNEKFYMVPYEYIFCAFRNGQMIMIGGRVLCEAVYEEGAVEEDGMMVKKSESGIITDINVKHDLKKAFLSQIGTPLKGAPALPVVAGDEVWYPKDADFENTINGKKYFCMVQEDLLMYRPKN